MCRRICSFFRRYAFTLICVALILALSFFSPPHTALDNVAMIDKWTHLLMYGGTVGVFWIEYWRQYYNWGGERKWSALWLVTIALITPIVLGGVIELAQAYCTNGRRSGEWLDWVADSLGVLLANACGITICRWIVKKAIRRKMAKTRR